MLRDTVRPALCPRTPPPRQTVKATTLGVVITSRIFVKEGRERGVAHITARVTA